MKRRDFLTLATAGTATFGFPSILRSAERRRMNVLFIAADDLKPLLGCYGTPLIKTPNIDRLAQQGLQFNRAYCQQAVCAPSRNSLLTGLRPDTIGIYDLATFFRTKVPDAVTLPQCFKQNGYHSEGMGKIYHTGHGNQDDAASWSVKSWRPRGGQYVLPANNEMRKKIREEGKAKGLRPEKMGNPPPTECADVADSAYSEGMIADHAIERLRALKDQSFFMAVGFLKPHLPFNAPKKYWDLYDRSSFKLPDRMEPPKNAPAYAGTSWGELRKYTDIPDVGPLTKEKALELIHGYHACVSFVDAQVGRLLKELDQQGLREQTAIVLWGDHGWHLGDHGFWCKHTNYEQAVRVPLLLSVPGQKAKAATSDALVEFVDIYPTLCDACGVKKPETLEGTSMIPLTEKPDRTWKKAAFSQYPRGIPNEGRGMGYSLRTERYRIVEWAAKGKPVKDTELYDYQTDPEETENLAGRPEHAQTVKELSALLNGGWRGALGDAK